jgi:DNA recombination protein RmuC
MVMIIFGFGLVFYLIERKFKELKEAQKEDKSLLLLNQSIQSVHERLDRAAKIIAEVNKELGGVKEIGHQMQSLQDFLRSPKLRGNIGEQVLKDLLEQYFSRQHFELQYKFSDGQIVDAILKTKEGIIPIDSKFPLENFRKLISAKNEDEKSKIAPLFYRDVKRHVDSISKKYILPQEGTVDFAIMYIPSEAVYYEIISADENLDEYAREKNVYFVSPNSFYYFLKIIMMGMRGQQLQEEVKKIFQLLSAIQKDTQRLGEIIGVLTTHINNAKNAIDKVNNEFFKLSSRIDQTKFLK